MKRGDGAIGLLKAAMPGEWVWCGLAELPKTSGLYAIFCAEKLLYIGKAANFKARFKLHQIECGRICYRPFNGDKRRVNVFILPCAYDAAEVYEPELIRKLIPSHNIVHAVKQRRMAVNRSISHKDGRLA